jgi:galactokinase/mevalonate kinase-like predicted kinase
MCASAGHGSAPARAALAGNPSDGYGGAVLAVAVAELRAEAVATPAARSAVSPSSELVSATVARLERELLEARARATVQWRTSIPRGLGLGGSSAIVIATIRALCDLHELSLSRDSLAALALAVETEELGIAAGPQDRVAQAYGGLTFMDFAGAGRYEPLDPLLLPPLIVAWRAETAADSGPLHSDLRVRFARGDDAVVSELARAAAAAHEARAALLAADHGAVRRGVDATFDARRRMMSLDPRHVEMVSVARAAGAAANYTGSGGAVVAVCRDETHREAVAEQLGSAGCGVVLLQGPATVLPNPVT